VRQPIPFGKYVLLERISVGGMAEVFKAKSFGVEGFEKILAIKRILPSLAEDSDFIDMFIDEAKICGQLNHANICQIFELGRVQDSHFIAMEFVWGKDLLQIQNRLRKQRSTMKPEMAAFVAAKLCEGLDYAHKKKDALGKPLHIIHRDISPQNILLSYEGELKIIDFGIAKAASRSSKTQAGVLKGKFGYMSPEQVRGLPLDRRSDVFAIGTILYELLTADRLFVGESDFETLEKVRNVTCAPISKVNPKVPPALEKIIMKALAKDAEDRYQWASEMMEDLHSFLVSFEPVFTAKQLAGWMRESFAIEMRREQEILDEQRRIGKEVLNAGVAQGFGTGALSMPARSAAPVDDFGGGGTNIVDDSDLLAADEGDEDLEEKTTVSEPAFGASIASPTPAVRDQKTSLLDDAAAAPAARASQAAGAVELPAQPTVILADATPASDPPPRQANALPAGGRVAPRGTSQMPVALPYPGRSTLWKDILVGVGVAAALVVTVLGARSFLGSGSKGTLVVMANPARAADVLIDGVVRGHLEENKPLTLKDLPAGAHTVLVKAEGGAEFRQAVTLQAGDVSVLSAALKNADAQLGTGLLKLNVAAADHDGTQVEVDGAQLADGTWKSAIPLRADVAHEIRVTRPQHDEVKLSVTLKAGEEQKREIALAAGHGKIRVTTDPDGAEISLNGKKAGVTPAMLGDLDPGKTARVTVRHKGFQSITKYITFDKGLDQQLDLKLVASSDDGSDEPAPKAKGGTVLTDVAMNDDRPSAKSHVKDKERDELAPVKGAPAKDAAKTGAPAASEPGFLVANTQPWAKVFIDGKDTGKTTPIAPRSKIPLKPGRHVVTFVANGKKFDFDVMIKPAEDTRLIKQLTDSGP
jgi:hypothetical protein